MSNIPIVKVGDRLRDNDPRSNGKVVEVIDITTGTLSSALNFPRGVTYAVYNAGKRKAKIRTDRIYADDGKTRKTGWTLVKQEQQAA